MKTVLITGGNVGIGYEAATQFLNMGHHVILACRNQQKAIKAVEQLQAIGKGKIEFILLDLADFDSVKSLAHSLKMLNTSLDVLILNAGIMTNQRTPSKYPGVEQTLVTNHLGHLLLVHELIPCMANPSRIVIVASSLHDPKSKGSGMPVNFDYKNLDGNKLYNGMLFYKNSKLANVWVCYSLVRQLPGYVTVNALNPGFIPVSELSRETKGVGGFVMKRILPWFPFTRTIEHGGKMYVFVSLDESLNGITGKYFDDFQEIKSSNDSYNPDLQQKCWEWSCNFLEIPINWKS